MAVRIVTCGAASREAAEDWVRRHADAVRDVPGIEELIFMDSMVPPQVGAVLVDDSDGAAARLRSDEAFERLVDSLRRAWADGEELVSDEEYWIMEV